MSGRKLRVLQTLALAFLLMSTKASPAAADKQPSSKGHYTRKKLSFGNLRKLQLESVAGGYSLNGIVLAKVTDQPLCLSSADQAFKVRITFLETVLVSQGEPASSSKKPLMQDWANRIPLVAEVLRKRDSIGSMKPVVYDLIEPQGRTDLSLQEELVLLWFGDQTKRSNNGDTTLLPPSPFLGQVTGDTALLAPAPFLTQVIDVQYRGLQGSVDWLIGKIILQILYIRDHSKHLLLGGFVIVSKPDGEYEFYSVPRGLLGRIVLD